MTGDPRVVILAAGLGTRMRSGRPKVLHTLGGTPLIDHVVGLASLISDTRPVVVLNPEQPAVAEALGHRAEIVYQANPRGSGDALRRVPAEFRSSGPVVVLSGDVALLRDTSLTGLVARHTALGAACTLLTAVPSPSAPLTGLGIVVRGEDGLVTRIVEERDLTDGFRSAPDRNVGIYVFDGARLWPALDRLTTDNAQGEYYLTQVIELLDGPVAAFAVADPTEALGINDRRELALAEAVLRGRVLTDLMRSGVTVIDPATTYVSAGVRAGRDTIIHPMTTLGPGTVLGRECEIGPQAILTQVVAGDRVRIGASVLEDCQLADDVTIGHFNRIRPGTRLAQGVSLGTHAEVKNSSIGAGTRINHFSCVLDSDLADGVNVGAGTVTCNYDGDAKHRTTIGRGVFVGTNSTLVAPVTIADGAYVAAGSLINSDVPEGALAIGRAHQRNVIGWAVRRRRKQEARS